MASDSLDSNYIKGVVIRTFPKLNDTDRTLLEDRLVTLIEHIIAEFHITDNPMGQLKQNNGRDILGFLLMLLPFIDDSQGDNKGDITQLSDILTTPDGKNQEPPRFKYSNISYDHNYYDGNSVEANYRLLLNTVSQVAHKLYVNWTDVLPVGMSDYNGHPWYQDTVNAFYTNQISDNRDTYKGMPLNDMYNALSVYLYEDVQSIKWLMYTYCYPVSYLDTILPKINQGPQFWLDLSSSHPKVARDILLFYDNSLRKKIKGLILEAPDDEGSLRVALKDPQAQRLIDEALKGLNSNSNDSGRQQIYNYILQSIEKFKKTWYGYQYFKTGFKYNNEVTLKNVHNYAKSITHSGTGKNFQRDASLWRSHPDTNQDGTSKGRSHPDTNRFISRINSPNPQDWFSIKGYLKNVLGVPTDQLNGYNSTVYDGVRQALPDILFQTLVLNGLLSRFKPAPHITGYPQHKTMTYSQKMADIKAKIGGTPYPKDSYYFLNNAPYGGTNSDLMSLRDGNWNTTYAMDWVSQIAFYHRYLNNRVIFVTGSTGVGKSTQIPKLLMYSLKMLDGNLNGKIICTQPRIPPTEGNAKTISSQMGVPVFEPGPKDKQNASTEKKLTDNYYIQFKHKREQHTKNTTGLMLKIVTDGTLYMELLKYPLLKSTKLKKGVETTTNNNIYDIIIVDEAHEHNKNMDLILTMMRYAAYYNNSTKLVIISATMDDDEFTYRRYYKGIPDTQIYPITYTYTNTADRIHTDRRLHISPPGETTRFKIEDIYRPGYKFEDQKTHYLALDAVKEAIRGPPGDVLLFLPTESMVKMAALELNKSTDSRTIAIPFYGKMSQNKRRQIEDLKESNKSDFRPPKQVQGKPILFDDDYDQNIQGGSYTRIIIVATNVAEASITVPTLRYVVDTGIQNTVSYDYTTRQTKANIEPISESSRLQRRGRVGRVADGTVYYLYEEGSREQVPTKYDISISDIHTNLADLMRNSTDEQSLVSDNSVKKVLQSQGALSQGGIPPPDRSQTGYHPNIVTDPSGGFYIIHPEELCIKRDKQGGVAGPTNFSPICRDTVSNKKINSNKMATFWDILQEELVIYKDEDDKVAIGKTEYGKRLNLLISSLDLDDGRMAVAYVYSRKYEVPNEVLQVLAMVKAVDGDITRLFSTYVDQRSGKTFSNISEGKSNLTNQYGDLEGMLQVSNKVLKLPSIQKALLDNNLDGDSYSRIKSQFRDHPRDWPKGTNYSFINYRTIVFFLQNYAHMRFKLTQIDPELLDWFKDSLEIDPKYTTRPISERVTLSFMHGYGLNIIKKIGASSCYVQVKNPSPVNINRIQSIGKDPTTLLAPTNREYAMFLSYSDSKGFSILSSVNPQDIQNIVPFGYSSRSFNPTKYDTEENQREFNRIVASQTNVRDQVCAIDRLIGAPYNRALQIIKGDMASNFKGDVYKRLSKLDGSKGFEKYIERHQDTVQTGGGYPTVQVNPYLYYPLSRYLYRKIHKVNI